jgi:hypothetical protein
MRRAVAVGMTLLAASLALGCTPVTSPLDLSGVYSLKTVNGIALPYVLPQVGATVVTLWNDEFTLNSGGTYAEQGYKSYTTGGVINVAYPVDAGYFTRRDNVVTLESLIFGTRPANIVNGSFTIVQDSLTLVYQR